MEFHSSGKSRIKERRQAISNLKLGENLKKNIQRANSDYLPLYTTLTTQERASIESRSQGALTPDYEMKE